MALVPINIKPKIKEKPEPIDLSPILNALQEQKGEVRMPIRFDIVRDGVGLIKSVVPVYGED